MERVDSLISDAREAGLRKVAASVSRLAKWEDLLCLGSGDFLQTLTIEANDGAKKVIAQKVSGSVKWYNVKHGYGFINRHDTKEEVFVHHSAIARTGPRRYHRGVDAGEAVEFDVVQGKRGTEAANVTGPAGAPVKGSRFSPGFCIRHDKLQQLPDVGDADDGGREGYPAAQGRKHHQTRCRRRRRRRRRHRPRAQQWQRFPSCRVLAATRHPATFSAPAPAAGPEGIPPRRGHGPSYRLSRPRGRGTAPDPKPSPDLVQELEAEEESRINAIGLQQGFRPCYTCHCPNKLCDCHRPQQLPGKQGQKPGGEGELGKGPVGKPTCVAEKTSTSEEKAAVAKATSAARAQ